MFNELDKSVFDAFDQTADYEEAPQTLLYFCDEKGLSPNEKEFIVKTIFGGKPRTALSTVLRTEYITRSEFEEAYAELQNSVEFEDPSNTEFLNEDESDSISIENVLGIAGLLQKKEKGEYTDAESLIEDLIPSLETIQTGERVTEGGTIRNILNTLVGINKARRCLPGNASYSLRLLAFNADENKIVTGVYPKELRAFQSTTFTPKFLKGVASKIKNVNNDDVNSLGLLRSRDYEIYFTKGVATKSSKGADQLHQIANELINPKKKLFGSTPKPTSADFNAAKEWAEKDVEGAAVRFPLAQSEVRLANQILKMDDEKLKKWVNTKMKFAKEEPASSENSAASNESSISLDDLKNNDPLVNLLTKLYGKENLLKLLTATSEKLSQNSDLSLGDSVVASAKDQGLKKIGSKTVDKIEGIENDIIEDKEETMDMQDELMDILGVENEDEINSTLQAVSDTIQDNPEASEKEIADLSVENLKTEISAKSYDKIKKNVKNVKNDLGNFIKKHDAKLRAQIKKEIAEYDMTASEEMTFKDLQRAFKKDPNMNPTKENPIKVRAVDKSTGKNKSITITSKKDLLNYLPRLEKDFLSDGTNMFDDKSAYASAMKLRNGEYGKDDVHKVLTSFAGRLDPNYKGDKDLGIKPKTIANKKDMTKALRQLGLIEKKLKEAEKLPIVYLTNGDEFEIEINDLRSIYNDRGVRALLSSYAKGVNDLSRAAAALIYFMCSEMSCRPTELFETYLDFEPFLDDVLEDAINASNDVLYDSGSPSEIDFVEE